uniref:YggT family protein n=1 Tax=Thermodesulfobacterium geofontis TaxID=1295609 RepID=A0A7C4NVT5_9BACT
MKILLSSFIQLIDLLLSIYIWIIIARAIISWITPYPYHPLVRFLYKVTEPILAPIRKIIPPIGGIDISPVIVIFIIFIIKNLLHRFLINLITF